LNLRKLGSTDLLVSPISIGCSGYWGQRSFSEAAAQRVIHEAFAHGVNLFDTGHSYCNYHAEPRLGRVLADIIRANSRDKVVISTKAGSIIEKRLIDPRPKVRFDFTPQLIYDSCAASLRNLQVDTIDIFQMHGMSQRDATDELLTTLARLKQRGMVRYIGLNTHVAADMAYLTQQTDVFDVALIDYNLLQLDREPYIASMASAGLGVMAGTVLAQGHLLRAPRKLPLTLADAWYWARATFKPSSRRLATSASAMRDTLQQLAGITPLQAALGYVLANPAISTAVIGTTRVEHLQQVVQAVKQPLSAQVIGAMNATYRSQQNIVSL
jgi:1-deoxyxylulose-5-phosphate synthase